MASDIMVEITQAWKNQLKGQADAAIASYERILSQDKDSIDALYGMGLAQRDNHQNAKAAEYFRRALELVQAATRLPTGADEERTLTNTPEDDRNMMLVRMINQRLAEIANARP